MRSNLDQAVRRQILADIGIDVWRTRTGAPVAAEGAESRSGLPAGRADDRSHAPSPTAAAGARQRPPTATGAVGTTAPASGNSTSTVTRPQSAVAAAEPFSVLSLSAGGVTLLIEREPAGREARLVRDLLAAATGRWDVEPAQRRFDWPPAVVVPGASGAGAADRAVRAFVEKELADHGSVLVMLGDALARRLGELRHACERLLVPDPAVLGRDPAEKRRVWAALGRLRRAAEGPTAAAGPTVRAAGDAVVPPVGDDGPQDGGQ